MKIYKVVRRRRDGKLASVIMKRGRLCVTYEPDEETHSLNGMKLLAFDTEITAKRFYEGNSWLEGDLEIWEAKAANPTDCPFLSSDWRRKAVEKWWTTSRGAGNHSMLAPPGTVACDSITLIKRVS